MLNRKYSESERRFAPGCDLGGLGLSCLGRYFKVFLRNAPISVSREDEFNVMSNDKFRHFGADTFHTCTSHRNKDHLV